MLAAYAKLPTIPIDTAVALEQRQSANPLDSQMREILHADGRSLGELRPLRRSNDTILSKADKLKLLIRLKRWAQMVRGKGLNYTCSNASVPRRLLLPKARSGYGTRDADSWHVCYDGWKPWAHGCLGVSIGIGGEWGFEDGLVQQVGCRLFAYDPTEELARSHASHAAHISRRFDDRMRFSVVGLGGDEAQHNTASKRYGSFNSSKGNIKTLGSIMASVSAGTQSARLPIIDVLKIDCEGCEWTAFREVEDRQPHLLSRVRIILLEVHSIKKYGLASSAQVDRLLSFLIDTHGFRVYRSGFNKGWPGARNKVKSLLVQAGFPALPCCWLLHLMRPPQNDTWLRLQ